jgi:hypothetical protein
MSRRMENTMPAVAAARGVLRAVRVSISFSAITGLQGVNELRTSS